MPGPGRLRRKSEFRKVFEEGKIRGNRALRIRYRKNEHDRLRLAFIMSKKMAGAVKRNRIRRVLFEEIRKRSSTLTHQYDIVIFPREEALREKPEKLRESIASLLTESGMAHIN
jgi:ribonuclease P protein component